MTHWERATQPSGQADHPDAGPHPVGFGGAADPIAATPHASTGRTGSAPGTVTTNGDHASAATPGAIDAPDLAAEALLLEMLERALRSEARRHGVQLEGGLL